MVLHSRAILSKGEKINILLDSKSYASQLASGSFDAETFLHAANCQYLHFFRTPFKTDFRSLREILEIRINNKTDGEIESVEIPLGPSAFTEGQCWSKLFLQISKSSIDNTGKTIFNREELRSFEVESLSMVFIQRRINEDCGLTLLVTEEDTLLKKRDWLESTALHQQLNIVRISEAKEIMDLFLKVRSQHYIRDNSYVNIGYWYLLSARSKVPHLILEPNMGTDTPLFKLQNSMLTRLTFLLMSIDREGFSYYADVNNDTTLEKVYSFNYYASLVTGVLDNLALITWEKDRQQFPQSMEASRISLSSSAGGDFLDIIRSYKPQLRKHIENYANFISLMHDIRNTIIHRELLNTSTYIYTDENGEFKAGLIKMEEEIVNRIRAVGDNNPNPGEYSKWGRFNDGTGELSSIEPYLFSKVSAKILLEFSDGFLTQLGYTNFIDDLNKKGTERDNARLYQNFIRYRLGF